MAAIRTFFKRNVGQRSSNNNNPNSRTTTDSSSDTSSSTTTERVNNQANDGCSSTSTLGVLTNTNGDPLRHPLLNISTTKHHRRFLLRLVHNSTIMNKQEEELINENTGLLDTILPKELILR
ncbi:unnamed protein product [Rotaria sp. Silwood2]|nr:unnamed protein product [Rotaria sp. Silwood2]